jgi:hypothetical protein
VEVVDDPEKRSFVVEEHKTVTKWQMIVEVLKKELLQHQLHVR